MSIISNLRKIQKEYFGVDLPAICSALHMGWNGSSDPLINEEVAVKLLKSRLEVWQEPSSKYDNAIKELIKVTLEEQPK